MRFASVCSGIEAPSVAWASDHTSEHWPASLRAGLGWEPAWYSEIDPFPCAVLAHHHPRVPNLGNMEAITDAQLERHGPVDVLVGGTPCQSFSVAGLRKGLDDPRGNLALVYLRLAERLGARWLVWENVPGVLSSWSGEPADAPPNRVGVGPGERVVEECEYDEVSDFGCFLAALAKLGYGFAYRVLDAQFAGVAQRRRRVFVVAHLGDGRAPASVLVEPSGLRGDPAPCRASGSDVARSLGASTGGCSGKEQQHTFIGRDGPLNALDGPTHTLSAEGCDASEDGTGRGTPIIPAVLAHGQGGAEVVSDGEPSLTCNHEAPIVVDSTQVTHPDNRSRCEPGEPSPTLAKGGHPPAVCFQPRVGRNGRGTEVELCPTLAGADAGATSDMRPCVAFTTASHPLGSEEVAEPITTRKGGAGAVAQAVDAYNGAITGDVTATLSTAQGAGACGVPTLMSGTIVRRLTPRECERLQGFPDDYTLVAFKGKPAADTPRYKALGNSMAVPVMRWLGRRIALADAVQAELAGQTAETGQTVGAGR